jgi:hypothetical protein
MNSLEKYLIETKRHEATAMNDLQLSGVISDHCVWAENAAERDCVAAIEFLKASDNRKRRAGT